MRIRTHALVNLARPFHTIRSASSASFPHSLLPPITSASKKRFSSCQSSKAATALAINLIPTDADSQVSSDATVLQPLRENILVDLCHLRETAPSPQLDTSHIPPSVSTPDSKPARLRAWLTLQKIQNAVMASDLLEDPVVVQEFMETATAYRDLDSAIQVLEAAVCREAPLDIEPFRLVARHIRYNKKWEMMPHVVELSERSLGYTSWRMLEDETRSYIERKQYTSLHRCLERYTLNGLVPHAKTYDQIVRLHLKNGDVASADATLAHMAQAGIKPTTRTHAMILDGATSIGLTPKIQAYMDQALNEGSPPTTEILNAALKHYILEEDLAGARRIIDRFDVSTISTPDTPSASSSRAVLPDATTYGLLVDFHAQRGNLAEAINQFSIAMDAGLQPTRTMTVALVKAHVTAGDRAGGFDLVRRMCRGHALFGEEVEAALHDLEQFIGGAATVDKSFPKSDGLCRWDKAEVHVRHFAPLASSLIRKAGLEVLLPILRIAHSLKLELDYDLFLVIIQKSHVRQRDYPQLVEAMMAFGRSIKEGAISTPFVNAILAKYVKRPDRPHKSVTPAAITPSRSPREKESSITARGEMKARITSVTGRVIVPGERAASAMAPAIKSMEERGVLPDRHSLALLMRREGVGRGDMVAAREVFDYMVHQRGLKPRLEHYAALMAGYVRQGNMSDANRLLGTYKRSMITPHTTSARDGGRNSSVPPPGKALRHVVLWTILILGYGKIGRPDQSRLVMEDLVNSGITPDVFAVDALARVQLESGRPHLARAALLDFWPTYTAGPLTEELQKLPLKKLVKAMWMESGKVEAKGEPPRVRGFSKREALELGDSLAKIVATLRGDSIPAPRPKPSWYEASAALPSDKGPKRPPPPGPARTLPGRSHMPKYLATSWSERGQQ